MYYPYFMTYIGIGLTLVVVVFFWALKNGQFSDQQRARYLPLEDEGGAMDAKGSRIRRIEIYTLAFLACAGLAASAAVLVYALYTY